MTKTLVEKPCLNNKDEYPDDAVLVRCLGETKKVWDKFIEMINKNYPSLVIDCHYYNDGKSWLFKVTFKKKTIIWVATYINMFRATFYFNDKANDLIKNSKLNSNLKEQFFNKSKIGKTRGISVLVKNVEDLDTIKMLIDIKDRVR